MFALVLGPVFAAVGAVLWVTKLIACGRQGVTRWMQILAPAHVFLVASASAEDKLGRIDGSFWVGGGIGGGGFGGGGGGGGGGTGVAHCA